MVQYIIKRLLLLPLLLFIFSVFAFLIIQAPPGDFVTAYIAELAASGSSMARVQIEALREMYGLDQPIYTQYLKWMGRIVKGDMGVSLDWQRPILDLIGERLLLTLLLGLFTFAFTWAVAIPIGIYSATHQYSFFDYFWSFFSFIGVSVPPFVLALIFIWIAFDNFGISALGLFSPEYEYAPWSVDKFLDMLKHIWMI